MLIEPGHRYHNSYFEKLIKLKKGRLVPKAFAVNNPGFHEIKDVLMEAGFQIWLEDKVKYNF